jgi:hypothetical protein
LWADASDLAVSETPVDTYICPSFRGPIVRPYYLNGDTTTTRRAMMDYTGNGGVYGLGAGLNLAGNSLDGAIVPSKSGSGLVRKLADFVDGTSETLLIGEKFVEAAGAYDPNWTRDGSIYGVCNDDQGYVDGWDNDTICFGNGFNGPSGPAEPPKQIDPRLGSEDDCGFNFGSIHANLMAVFCDGSVHAIGFDINPTVWVRLCKIDDGQPAGFDDQS